MSNKQLPPGTKVRTNAEYEERTGRQVEGRIIRAFCEIDPESTIVLWEKQTGNIDERLHGLKVIMRKKYLEVIE